MPATEKLPVTPLAGSLKGKVVLTGITRKSVVPTCVSVPVWGVGADCWPVRSVVVGAWPSGVMVATPDR